MKWLILFSGGGVGAVLRFATALWVDERLQTSFPWGTFAVNAIGCLAIGLLATLADEAHAFTPLLRLFLVAGVLGGFTTFSTFSLESWRLVEDGHTLLALANITGSASVCIVAAILGVELGRALT